VNCQLTFDLSLEPALAGTDFFVSPSNETAVRTVFDWRDWPQGKLALVGPPGSGKTHLAHIWATRTDARLVSARDIGTDSVDRLAAAPVAVEDADAAVGDLPAEEALLHLHNLALERNVPLLVTARTPPARWDAALADLRSRMQGAVTVSLSQPDDRLLSAVLLKLFADRQVSVGPDVIQYLTRRIERSFAGVGHIVEALDSAAMAEGRRITTALARQVLDKLARDGR